MSTAIGKELRKLRIDHEERLLDMANRLDKSASFISAIEVGKKAPPVGFEELIIKAYGLASTVAESFRRAADMSRKAFVLEPNSALARDTAGLLARKMNTLSDEQLREIQTILGSRSKK